MDEAKRNQRQKWASMHQAGQIAQQSARKANFDLQEKFGAAVRSDGPVPTLAEIEAVRELFRTADHLRHEADAYAQEVFGVPYFE